MAKEARELEETGVEVPAVLVAVEPLMRTDTRRAHYEYPRAGGSRARHTMGVGPNTLHVVGETFSLVRLPRVAKKVHTGTMAAARRERRDRERYVRHAVWMMVSGFAACAVAVTGLVLLPRSGPGGTRAACRARRAAGTRAGAVRPRTRQSAERGSAGTATGEPEAQVLPGHGASPVSASPESCRGRGRAW
ncbi:hypothetical protein [Streptomyces lavendulocolor]|uniref:hypothetical protein n=1 Tax=Streptomyces lavendulocolor TaxID=67316 RepID=UPI003C2E0AE8